MRRYRHVSGQPPRVSVLVPARNEARNIVDCIESLARQDSPDFEIIALNDQSTDNTGALLDGLAARYPMLRVLHGTESPPAGWNGKSYACQRLADAATGDWLLFTDADTRHTPSSITQGIAQAEALGVALLSAFPNQETESWSERLLVSFILDFLPLLSLDLESIWRGTTESSAANGQYLMVRRDAYHAAGGHAAIFDALLDDFALARHFRRSGYRLALVDGSAMVSCRMYQNAGELWQGFTRSLLPALETSSERAPYGVRALLFAWGYSALFYTPLHRLLLRREPVGALLVLGWLMVLRGIVNRYLERPLNEVVTTPLAGWGVMLLGLGALGRRAAGGQVVWKGRHYSEKD